MQIEIQPELKRLEVERLAYLLENDISPEFVYDGVDAAIAKRLIGHENSPRAIRVFSNECHKLTNYSYWFLLSTLWVQYTGWSDLQLWRRLLSSNRPLRNPSIMKPSELSAWNSLPETLTLYRAHRPNETDWISYTLSAQKAAEFAHRRSVYGVHEYSCPKSKSLCLFLRRGEFEVLVLDRSCVTQLRVIPVVLQMSEQQKASV